MGVGRVVMILGVGVLSLWGSWNYRVLSPLMGTLGTIQISKSVTQNRYRMDVKVKTKGFARTLTGKRREHYSSEGVVENGVMKSRHLRLERQTNKKRQVDDYWADPEKKRIVKRRLRWKKGKLDQNSTKVLPYYSDEDLLTLYFNAIPKILDPKSGDHWEIMAVGAEKIKGKIIIDRLSGEAAARARRDLKVGENMPIIVLHSPRKIAGKRNRRFTAALDEEGLPFRIRFIAIPVVGEILVERVEK